MRNRTEYYLIYFPPSRYMVQPPVQPKSEPQRRGISDLRSEHGNTVTYCFFNFFREVNKPDLGIDKTSLVYRL